MEFGLQTVIFIAVIAALFGTLCGYVFTMAGQRRAGGGKTIAELAKEHEQYREGVAEHFKTTAALLHEMTDKYREVYRHMADGAQTLVTSDAALPALEQLRGDLVGSDEQAVANRPVADEQSEPLVDADENESSVAADYELDEAADLTVEHDNDDRSAAAAHDAREGAGREDFFSADRNPPGTPTAIGEAQAKSTAERGSAETDSDAERTASARAG